MTDKQNRPPKQGQPNPPKPFSTPPRTVDDVFNASEAIYSDIEEEQAESLLGQPNYTGSTTGKSGAPGTGKTNDNYYNNNKSAIMDPNKKGGVDPAMDEKLAPTGMMAWVGFGCCIMALACLSISFCSPYWLQTWPMSENKFRNIGLWQVCFHNYMQFKDDSQQIYDGCWWVFDSQTKYYKLREWLIPPWFISCQVLTVGCLLIEIATALVTGAIFLHFCPVLNHEYLQTYGIFASASMMFLVSMISFVVAIVFGVQCNDRYWLPRPDQNYLSWGFGFLIINAIFATGGGVCLFMEGQRTYDGLLRKEDEYTKQALEMSAFPPADQMSYPPNYDLPGTTYDYGPAGNVYSASAPSYDDARYGPGGGRVPPPQSYGGQSSNGSRPTSYEKEDPSYSKLAPLGPAPAGNGSRPSSDEKGRPYEEVPLTTKAPPYQGRSFEQRPTSYDSDQ